MNITTVGIDLAKNVFQVHGVDARGKVVLRKQFKRDQLARFFVNLPPCLIGLEACASAHHWGRVLEGFGHTARLMAPQFVKPYVKANKNDVADAEAICEAVGRPNMRFVPIKSIEQQAILSIHRVRQGFVKARTAQANQIRGLLGSLGSSSQRASATAPVASIADARSFDNGRQLSAWLGLVPRQNSSGGKATLLGISKRGDVYALRVRKSDWEPASRSHQGQRHLPQQKSGCTGAIYPGKPSELRAWQGWGRPCTEAGPRCQPGETSVSASAFPNR
jgi:transposase